MCEVRIVVAAGATRQLALRAEYLTDTDENYISSTLTLKLEALKLSFLRVTVLACFN